MKAARKRFVLRSHQSELNLSDERIEPRSEFQIVGAATWKE